jgi:hypothetical protein
MGGLPGSDDLAALGRPREDVRSLLTINHATAIETNGERQPMNGHLSIRWWKAGKEGNANDHLGWGPLACADGDKCCAISVWDDDGIHLGTLPHFAAAELARETARGRASRSEPDETGTNCRKGLQVPRIHAALTPLHGMEKRGLLPSQLCSQVTGLSVPVGSGLLRGRL